MKTIHSIQIIHWNTIHKVHKKELVSYNGLAILSTNSLLSFFYNAWDADYFSSDENELICLQADQEFTFWRISITCTNLFVMLTCIGDVSFSADNCYILICRKLAYISDVKTWHRIEYIICKLSNVEIWLDTTIYQTRKYSCYYNDGRLKGAGAMGI